MDRWRVAPTLHYPSPPLVSVSTMAYCIYQKTAKSSLCGFLMLLRWTNSSSLSTITTCLNTKKTEHGWYGSLICDQHRLLAIGLTIAEYLFASIMSVSCIQKCHNDSHRHGTILKEVAIIFSFDLYNRFDCFWHEQTHEWFCHSGLDHIQECDWTYGHRCPLP